MNSNLEYRSCANIWKKIDFRF